MTPDDIRSQRFEAQALLDGAKEREATARRHAEAAKTQWQKEAEARGRKDAFEPSNGDGETVGSSDEVRVG